MNGLNGKNIALLEARLSSELARLVERHGGTAFGFPALREASIDAGVDVVDLIAALTGPKDRQLEFIVFQTGVGVTALMKEAEKLEKLDQLIIALHDITKVCRGPKPAAVLARFGLTPDVSVAEPYTTAEVLRALDSFDLKDRGTALLHYGERNLLLAESLIKRGVRLRELCLYEWKLPDDLEPLKTLIAQLDQGAFAAVVFTSQIQARHLFQVAVECNREIDLRESLKHKTVVASIGPTCSAALRALGVAPQVEPGHPKMGPLVAALARYFEHSKTVGSPGRIISE
jgi:uroporphyrinogen-III synthase